MKITRAVYQDREASFLAAYAVKSAGSKGRKYPEIEDDFRTPFQRDRDRIIHCTAFRRLEYKTQVFVNYEGDHYRTRLTHTLETAQIARSIGRALALNEDLVEAIALAHDLGHGPFGHAGEWALQDLMKDDGGFEHNEQCLRVVEKLEDRYPDFPGLNLTFETREGLRKHPREGARRFRSLEAEVVDIADEIGYMSHDLDDGLRSELILEEDVRDLSLWRQACSGIEKGYPRIQGLQRRRLAIRAIIHRLVTDVISHTQYQMKKMKIRSIKDIQNSKEPIVALSSPAHKGQAELKNFLQHHLYEHYRVIRMTDKGQRFLKALFEVFLAKPVQLPPEILRRSKREGIRRVICDYLAGMTDRFAMDEYKRFFEPYERV